MATDAAFTIQLQQISREIQQAGNFFSAMIKVQPLIKELLRCERITIYQSEAGKEIRASFRSSSDDAVIKVPFSPASLSGYVALTQKPLLLNDLSDKTLKAIHPKLHYDPSFARSAGLEDRSMIVVPIMSGKILLGVLQIINRTDGKPFRETDGRNVLMVAHLLGRHFADELQSTQGPYDYLLQQGKLDAGELAMLRERAAQQGKKLDQLLIEQTSLSADEIGQSLEAHYRVSFMKYSAGIRLPGAIIKRLKVPFLRANFWVPVFGNEDHVVVLLDDPSDQQKIMEIERQIGARTYELKVGLSGDILKFLDERASLDESSLNAVLSRIQRDADDGDSREDEERADSYDAEDQSGGPVTELVNNLIVQAVQNNASDIHIEPSKKGEAGVVRIRVDGLCREVFRYPGAIANQIASRIKVMARLDIAEKRLPQDGKIKIRTKERVVELRVATIPTVHGESVVLRVLAAGNALPLEKLNLSARNMAGIEEVIAKPHGLILVVGPTGSGKTTTLHGVLGHINTPDRKIWTAEDPVEITQPGLQQVQMNRKAGLDFASALRAFLRADPDVILIGEMRDSETAQIGIEASLTGHLVLSTLHTNSAPETIVRLLDLGLDPINFSDALLGILAQRLVRKLCRRCRQSYKASDKDIARLVASYGDDMLEELGLDARDITLHKAVGCVDCGGSGYWGRTAIHELLLATPTVKELIYRKADIAAIKRQAMKDGMRTLLQDGIGKLFSGDIEYAQLLRVTAE